MVGHTLSIFRKSIDVWARTLLEGRPVLLTNFLFGHAVLVKYPVYQECIHRAELEGQLRPGWPPGIQAYLGPNSILNMPGGKGHAHHKRMRGKILHSLAPKPCLEILPELTALVRGTLDAMAERCAKEGPAEFEGPAAQLAARASTLQITAGLSKELQERVEGLLDTALRGIFSLPVDLGPLTAFGRGQQARREVAAVLRELMRAPNTDRRSIIGDLMTSSESGEAFTHDEIVDTAATLLLAGKLTTSDALPSLLAYLAEQPRWAERIAREPLEFGGIEEDSATFRFVLEVLRLRPPTNAYRRVRDPPAPIDLGEALGSIPPGCPLAVLMGFELQDMGEDFDPDRWTPEVVRAKASLIFGGPQPHSCIGKNLALLELQLFARVLCREYDFRTIEPELVLKASNPIQLTYKNGLMTVISRKART